MKKMRIILIILLVAAGVFSLLGMLGVFKGDEKPPGEVVANSNTVQDPVDEYTTGPSDITAEPEQQVLTLADGGISPKLIAYGETIYRLVYSTTELKANTQYYLRWKIDEAVMNVADLQIQNASGTERPSFGLDISYEAGVDGFQALSVPDASAWKGLLENSTTFITENAGDTVVFTTFYFYAATVDDARAVRDAVLPYITELVIEEVV